jgi:hypothetical protein
MLNPFMSSDILVAESIHIFLLPFIPYVSNRLQNLQKKTYATMTQISHRKFNKENFIIHKSYHDKSHIFDQT